MSEKKAKKKRMSLVSYDPVENPDTIISADKDQARKEAFQETYKRIAKIIPEYFISQSKKRKKAASGGGNAFSQNIVVTPDKATVETKQNVEEAREDKQEEYQKERDD